MRTEEMKVNGKMTNDQIMMKLNKVINCNAQ